MSNGSIKHQIDKMLDDVTAKINKESPKVLMQIGDDIAQIARLIVPKLTTTMQRSIRAEQVGESVEIIADATAREQFQELRAKFGDRNARAILFRIRQRYGFVTGSDSYAALLETDGKNFMDRAIDIWSKTSQEYSMALGVYGNINLNKREIAMVARRMEEQVEHTTQQKQGEVERTKQRFSHERQVEKYIAAKRKRFGLAPQHKYAPRYVSRGYYRRRRS